MAMLYEDNLPTYEKTVTEKRMALVLRKAAETTLDGAQWVFVLRELGIQNYAEIGLDGKVTLYDLTDLQWVAVAAAVVALAEAISEGTLEPERS